VKFTDCETKKRQKKGTVCRIGIEDRGEGKIRERSGSAKDLLLPKKQEILQKVARASLKPNNLKADTLRHEQYMTLRGSEREGGVRNRV